MNNNAVFPFPTRHIQYYQHILDPSARRTAQQAFDGKAALLRWWGVGPGIITKLKSTIYKTLLAPQQIAFTLLQNLNCYLLHLLFAIPATVKQS